MGLIRKCNCYMRQNKWLHPPCLIKAIIAADADAAAAGIEDGGFNISKSFL